MTFCCLYQIISNNHLKHFKSLNFVQGHLMDKGLKVTYIHVSISNEWTKKQNLIQWREYIYFLIISQKKKHMAGYNNLLTHLLLPIVSIHFSLIILSTPSPHLLFRVMKKLIPPAKYLMAVVWTAVTVILVITTQFT